MAENKINNNLKRVRKKLKLFDQEALNWLLSDFMNYIGKDDIDDEEKKSIIEGFKQNLKRQEEALTPPEGKQQKLF